MDLRDALRRTTLHSPTPLIAAGDTVLVAVSGGPDSLALLHALHALQDELGLAGLFAAHFHHGLRGDDADADAAFVQSFCAERGIGFSLGQEDVAVWAERIGVSIQQAARTARYSFLARTAKDSGANKIATAHTQDDQIETVLMNVLRGTGLEGLRGIPSQREAYIRPILSVTRTEIEAYCAAHNLTPRQDLSNLDTSHYTRNRVRLELLPLLESDYAPSVRTALLRLSRIADADADYLETQARAALAEATLIRDTFHHTLSVPKLAGLHPAVLRAVLRAALTDFRGSREGITFDHIERLREAICQPRAAPVVFTTHFPFCHAWATSELLTLMHTIAPPVWWDVSAELSVLAEAALPEIGWTVRVAFDELPLPPNGAMLAVLDADKVDISSLVARNWRMGDRIAPRGMEGHTKKVQDIFTDAKVPRGERHKIPIVADKDGLLWVAGVVVCERVRLTDTTSRHLHLMAFPTRLNIP